MANIKKKCIAKNTNKNLGSDNYCKAYKGIIQLHYIPSLLKLYASAFL